MNMFIPMKCKINIQLKTKELTTSDIDGLILTKIKERYEGICSRFGFIKKNTMKIVNRSAGQFIKQNFNCNINYIVTCSAMICNPPQGSQIICSVSNINNLGILAEYKLKEETIIDILVPKLSAGIKSEIDIQEIKKGDIVVVEVCGKKYKLNDKRISIIGRVIKFHSDEPEVKQGGNDLSKNDTEPKTTEEEELPYADDMVDSNTGEAESDIENYDEADDNELYDGEEGLDDAVQGVKENKGDEEEEDEEDEEDDENDENDEDDDDDRENDDEVDEDEEDDGEDEEIIDEEQEDIDDIEEDDGEINDED
jgi:hypothetical protein